MKHNNTSESIRILLQIIDESYEKRAWHGTNLRGSIKGITIEQAAMETRARAPQYLGNRRSLCILEIHRAAKVIG